MNTNKKYHLIAVLILLLFPLLASAIIQVPAVVVHTKKDNIPKTKTIVSSVPVEVVTEKQKNKLQPINLSELLQKTTNIVVQYFDTAKASISMRGFGDNAAQNTLILLNGQPLANPDLGAPDINLLPVASIKQIEIVPNSSSILYGDQAVAGIVNIITQVPKKDFAKINMSYGSFATHDLGAEMAKSYKNGFGYDVNVGHFTSQHYRDHNAERKNHLVLNLNYHNKNTDAYLEYEDVAQKLQLAGTLTAKQVEEDRRQAKNNADQSNQHNRVLLMGLNQKLTKFWHIKIDGSIMRGRGDGVLTASNSSYDFNTKRDSYFVRPELLGISNFFNWTIKSILGVELKHAKYSYVSTAFGAKNWQTQTAVFEQLSFLLNSKFTLITGLRAARSGNNNVLPFAIGIHYHPNKHWHFYIRRAGNYRFPKVDENTDTVDNKPLKPQTGVAYETGFSWQEKPISLQFQLFQLNLTNEIAYIPLVNTPRGFGYNENLAKTKRRGIMLNLYYTISSVWNMSGGYSYVDPKFASGQYRGNIIPDVPKQVFNLATDYTFKQHWHLFFNMNYQGQHFPDNDVANQELVTGYTLYNIGLGYVYKKIRLTAKLDNLTNKKYNSVTVMTYNASGTPELFYYPAAGRNGSITLQVAL